jgi:aspartate/methionine/tyrosine aminotransferase
MFGLSSLRLGYVVCKNEDMYKHIQYYMEHMTVSVSKLPQMFLLNIINSIDMDKFERRCFESLQENRRIVRKIDSSVIEMLDDKSNEAGMFLWARLKNKKIFDKAKLNIIDGSPFGKEGFVRINIAFKTEMMQEIVDKINKACEKG